MTKARTATEQQNGDDNGENDDGGAKRGNKMREGIDGSILQDKEGDDFNNTKCEHMYIFLFSQNN